MAVYDGSIRIDTRLDTANFNRGAKSLSTGMKGIMSSLGGVALAAGIAVGAIAVGFGKTGVKAAQEFENALKGLQSVVEGQGRSFQKAKGFIEEYISDGLLSAAEASTAYKNLALRGYSDQQIQQTLTALKDSAAFGRQSSLTLGKAVVSATEGLKNENSILVDNAGVTKNVAKMWKEYAASIGTTYTNLTQQQKIQAEVNGILEETKFQTGDAAKIANSYSGRVLQLSFAFNNLKVAVGNALMPMLEKVIPMVTGVVNAFTKLANVVASASAILFGKTVNVNTQVADTAAAASGSIAEMGNAAEKAGKQAKGALAPFDELNVLSKDTGSADGGGVSVPDVGVGGSAITSDVVSDVVFDEKLIEKLDDLEFDHLIEGWKNLTKAVSDFVKSPAVLAAKEVGKEIAALMVEDVNHATGNVFNILADGLNYWTATAKGDWPEAVNTVWRQVTDAIDVLARPTFTMTDAIFGTNFTEQYDEFVKLWRGLDVGGWLKEVWNECKAFYPNSFKEIKVAWEDLKKDVIGKYDAMKASGRNFLTETVGYYPSKISEMKKAWGDLKDDFKAKMGEMRNSADTTLEEIKLSISEKWNDIKGWFDQTVAPKFTKKYWADKFSGIKEGAKDAFNGIIDIVERAVNGIIGKMNTLSWDIPEWVPGVGGETFGFDIDKISIPRLATGAVIPPNQEFLAVLGDQKHGKNLEAPESLIRQILREELAGLQTGGGDINIEFTGSLAQLARVLNPVITKEQKRVGGTLQTGGVL